MVKDLLKSLNSIHNDNKLSLEEKFLLTILIKYHNYKLNYAYPPYEVLMTECSTKRKAKISKIIKDLVEKGYIKIKKSQGNKNLYFINKHLYYNDENANESKRINVDSNGQKPLDGQIEVEEALEQVEKEEINKIIKATGATEEEAREELRVAKSKEGIKDIVQYTIGTINNKKRNEKELEKTVANKKQEINPKSFNNFPAREYDYDDLERKLLGWDKDEEEEQETEFLN